MWEYLLWLYPIGWLYAAVIVARWLIMNDGWTDTFGKIGAVAIGICIGWSWPLIIPGYWIYKMATHGLEDEK